MALRCRRLGALTSFSSLVALAAVVACSGKSGDDTTPALNPDSAQLDGGADGQSTRDAAIDDTPPGPLCTLTGAPPSIPGEVLVYSEEFNTGAVDTSKWNIGSGYLGHDTILNTASPANANQNDDVLQITSARNPSDTAHPYVSGWLDSLGKFARTYGKVEFRARFPHAAGVWYAIWGRPFSQSFPEIDLEVVNRSDDSATQLYFVNHWAPPVEGDDAGARRSFTMTNKVDVADFHTYTLTWTPGAFTWQRDGVTMFTADPQGVPDLPVYWIMNGWVGGWVGNPTDATPLPTTFEIDYVHVYRLDGLVADPVLRVNNPKSSYYSNDAIEVSTANFDEVCSQVQMYDGDTLLRTMSERPLRLPLHTLTPGPHDLKFVATDGARTVTETVSTVIKL